MKGIVRAWGFWLGSVLLWETVLQVTAFHSVFQFWAALGFSCAAAAVLAVLTGLPGWAGRLVSWILPPVLFLIYAVQLVYYDIFGSFLSLAYVSVGGAAVTAFWGMVLEGIWHCLPRLLLLAVPLAAFYLLRHREFFCAQTWKGRMTGLVCAAAIVIGLGGNTLLHQAGAAVDSWVEHFGVLTAETLDLKRQITGGAAVLAADGGLDLTQGGSYQRNILPEMDLERLDSLTEDERLKALNGYFNSLRGTGKNQYTGFFEGYNLIVVCAEAFSPYLIDETLTPTLYRLSHEGFLFQNFYNSFSNLTTNGEYSFCMGLLPDMSRMSMAVSINNDLPFCLGNMWSASGETAMAYHNNVGTFYNRINSHTNMGYEFKALGFGLDMEQGKPTSDLEMMEKTVDEYIGQEPFHTYYMTYSGHASYGFALNDISRQNQSLTEKIEGSETLRAYYACQLELERAMAYLVERLEKAGIAEHTVIVLTGDHMPYGLPEEDYAQLAGQAVSDPFWKYRNSFICWNGGMESPVVVEDYCCTQDILPTLLNLFGFDYDSRLLTGRDVLADCTHVAVLSNGSFLSEKLLYDSRDGSAVWLQEPDEEYAQELITAVESQFSVSAEILDTDYYGFAFSALGLSTGKTEHAVYASYTDISGTWYEDEVELLTARGALNGGGQGNFSGEDPASRAEFVTMLARGLQLPAAGTEAPFTDLRTGAWYSGPIAAAWKAGLFDEEETEFRPGDAVTAEEVQVMLERAAESLGVEDGNKWAETALEHTMAAQRDNSTLEGGQISRGAAAFLIVELLREMGEV